MKSDPLVSVCCITYNHAKYVRECLDGLVMQQTDFKYEIIIHDDASSDETQKIICEYVEKYPNLFVPILQSENQYSKGIKTILASFCYPRAKGKYIALCEGDDYWTDPYKLQKQVDFLEKHSEYSMCTSNVINLSGEKRIPSKWNSKEDRDLEINEIIMNGGLFIATCSIVFRFKLFFEMPDKARKLHVGDYPLQIYMAYKGKVRMIAQDFCVYRIAVAGSWTERQCKQQLDYYASRDMLSKELYLLSVMDEVTQYKYHNEFNKRKALYKYNTDFFFRGRDCIRSFMTSPFTIYKHHTIKHILFSFLPKKLKRKLRGK